MPDSNKDSKAILLKVMKLEQAVSTLWVQNNYLLSLYREGKLGMPFMSPNHSAQTTESPKTADLYEVGGAIIQRQFQAPAEKVEDSRDSS